jgi:hypothetical protein
VLTIRQFPIGQAILRAFFSSLKMENFEIEVGDEESFKLLKDAIFAATVS